MTNVVVGPSYPIEITLGGSTKPLISTGTTGPIDVTAGITGQPGPPGPEGGTPVVALSYDDWPPVDPQPDTLYLRLAP